MTTRREFIENSTRALFGSALLARTYRLRASDAPPPDPQFFVFVQIYGAWDVCLAFDPKDRTSRLSNGAIAFDQPYGFEEVRTISGIPLGPDGFSLGSLADRMTVINGIDMELDFGHTPVIAMTGDPSAASDKPFLQGIISGKHPYVRKCLIPHLYASYDGYFVGGPYAGKTVTVSRLDAYRVLFSGGSSDSIRQAAAHTRLAADGYSPAARQQIAQYLRALNSGFALREKIGQSGAVVVPPQNVTQFANFTGALFKLGITGSVTWSLGAEFSFDTHSNHYRDHPLGKALADLATFCEALRQMPLDDNTSIMDRTTIVMTGEYARTARLNGSQGKDHNFRTNTVVYMGHRATAGTFGASGERRLGADAVEAHCGLPVDFRTGKANVAGEVLKMRNVWAGSGNVLGVDLAQEFGANNRPIGFLG